MKSQNDKGTNVSTTKTNIWITSRCRMRAENRFRLYNNTSHLLLAWLSLNVISATFIRINIENNIDELSLYTAILSLFVFAFSLIVFGFRFGERATQHRECYLKLQKLYASEDEEAELKRQYHEILLGHENHSPVDRQHLIVSQIWDKSVNLTTSNGEKIPYTIPMITGYLLRFFCYWICVALVFILGLVSYVFII